MSCVQYSYVCTYVLRGKYAKRSSFHQVPCINCYSRTSSYLTCVAAIEEGGSVEVEIIKCVTLGPPEAGKSQLKKALSGEFETSSESTPVSTAAEVVMECFVQEELAWNKFDQKELQSSLLATVVRRRYDAHQSQFRTVQEQPAKKTPTSGGRSFLAHAFGKVKRKVAKAFSKQRSDRVLPDPMLVRRVQEDVHNQDDVRISETFSKLTDEVISRYSQATGDERLHHIRVIHMVDSGGQPSFFDFHPMVATSRSIYFLVYNSQEGLLARPKMTYRKPSTFRTKILPNPSQTNLDMIKRSFHTLHHCKEKFLRMEQELKNRLSDDNVTLGSDDVLPVIVVGSRKSQQIQDEKEASELLKSHCCQIQTWKHTQKQVVLVDSLDPSCSGVKKIRQAVSDAESKFKIRFPLLWFQCQLIFWSADDPALSVMPYYKLKQLCTQHQLVVSDDEFLAMLTTFHMLGIFSCPDIDHIAVNPGSAEGLHQSPVFTKPDVLYSQISSILEIPFRDLEAPGQRLAEIGSLEDLQRSGVLAAKSLELLGIQDTLGSFTGFHQFLLKCLVRWGLAAEVSQDPLQLFIPSILPPYPVAIVTPSESPIPSLALTITTEDTGDYYVPQGVFPHFVVSVMKRHSDGYGLDVGVGDATPRCRDVISFRKTPRKNTQFPYNIQVVDRIDHISVHITPARKGKDGTFQWSPLDCRVIIEDLKHSMEEAYSNLYQKSQLCSVIICCRCNLCPLSEKKDHLAHLNPEGLTVRCLSRECKEMCEENCDGVLEAILEGRKCTYVILVVLCDFNCFVYWVL